MTYHAHALGEVIRWAPLGPGGDPQMSLQGRRRGLGEVIRWAPLGPGGDPQMSLQGLGEAEGPPMHSTATLESANESFAGMQRVAHQYKAGMDGAVYGAMAGAALAVVAEMSKAKWVKGSGYAVLPLLGTFMGWGIGQNMKRATTT